MLLLLGELVVAHGLKDARIGRDLGAIDGDVAQLDQPGALAQLQCLLKQIRQRLQVPLPERGDRIVIGMLIGRQVTECHVVMRRRFDGARTAAARGIGIKQEASHHQRMIGS